MTYDGPDEKAVVAGLLLILHVELFSGCEIQMHLMIGDRHGKQIVVFQSVQFQLKC